MLSAGLKWPKSSAFSAELNEQWVKGAFLGEGFRAQAFYLRKVLKSEFPLPHPK